MQFWSNQNEWEVWVGESLGDHVGLTGSNWNWIGLGTEGIIMKMNVSADCFVITID